jgi:SAM-dependent methyltransferase
MTLSVLGLAGLGIGLLTHSAWRWIGYILGGYFLLGAFGMLLYSKVGKLAMRERLLDDIPWNGHERVLDVGCGRGLLTVGAARRLTAGNVVGVDVWFRRAMSGNTPQSVLENSKIEGVADRVEVKEGDARKLPFPEESFDVVISNFVLHEMKTRGDREQMVREIGRVLKPGAHVALVDFIFTEECVDDLQRFGVTASRRHDGGLSFWISAILNLGAVRTYRVVGRKA